MCGKKGSICIVIAVVLFSSFEVVLKYIAGQINPIQLTFTRFMVGFLFLLPFAVREMRRRGLRLNRRELPYFAMLGLFGISLSMPILHLAVDYTNSSIAAVLFSCNPVFVVFLAFFILREPIRKRHIAALFFEILGTAAIILPQDDALNSKGIFFALLSTFFFSLYGVMGKRKTQRYGGIVVTCFSFLFGSLILLLLIFATHIPRVAEMMNDAGLTNFSRIPLLSGYTWENLPYVLYVSVGVAGIGFCAYFLAMEYASASMVSLVYFFKPALSPLLAWWLHGEVMSFSLKVGVVLIIAGSLCAIVPGIMEQRRLSSGTAGADRTL